MALWSPECWNASTSASLSLNPSVEHRLSVVWNVALHLASALKSLHQRNRFHGHVTPRNMLFSSKKEPRLNDVILSNYFSSEATMETTEGKRKKLV